MTKAKANKPSSDPTSPVNPGNLDTVIAKEKKEEFKDVLVRNVVGNGRIALVNHATDFGVSPP